MEKLYTKFYETFDLGCAAYLITAGMKLEKIADMDQQRKTFLFEAKAQAKAVDYWTGGAMVDAKQLVNNLKDLKTRLHNG